MAVEAFDLITLAEVKERLNIPDGDTEFDADLQARINEISYWIHGDGICNFGLLKRHLIAKDYVQHRYQPPYGQDLITDNYPINSITTLEIGYNDESGNFIVTEDTPRYYIHRKKYSIILTDGWYYGTNFFGTEGYGSSGSFGYNSEYLSREKYRDYSIRLTYNAGYTTIPFDIKGIIKDIIAEQHTAFITGANGLKRYTIGDITMEWQKNLTEYQQKVLFKYTKRLI